MGNLTTLLDGLPRRKIVMGLVALGLLSSLGAKTILPSGAPKRHSTEESSTVTVSSTSLGQTVKISGATSNSESSTVTTVRRATSIKE